MAASLVLALVLSLTIALPDSCVLDQAVVTAVPPNTLHVITVSQCGAMKCWERWVEVDGRRIGAAKACSTSGGSSEHFDTAPPSKEIP